MPGRAPSRVRGVLWGRWGRGLCVPRVARVARHSHLALAFPTDRAAHAHTRSSSCAAAHARLLPDVCQRPGAAAPTLRLRLRPPWGRHLSPPRVCGEARTPSPSRPEQLLWLPGCSRLRGQSMWTSVRLLAASPCGPQSRCPLPPPAALHPESEGNRDGPAAVPGRLPSPETLCSLPGLQARPAVPRDRAAPQWTSGDRPGPDLLPAGGPWVGRGGGGGGGAAQALTAALVSGRLG